jgi:protein gp37
VGEQTAIEWCEHTFNPWWGCSRVSPGCTHCYAETFAHRLGLTVWGKTADRRFFGDAHWAEPLKWNAAAQIGGRSHRVFCASMADVFEIRPTAEASLDLERERAKLWDLIGRTPWLDWQLLTKRPENVRWLVPWEAGDPDGPPAGQWPANVWLGVTVEDQARADERIPVLLNLQLHYRIPVVFLSCEPLLEAVELEPWTPLIDWVIVGGESGPEARPMDRGWAAAIRDSCAHHDVPLFMKQAGSKLAKTWGTSTAKGDRLEDMPADFQIRQFPEVALA